MYGTTFITNQSLLVTKSLILLRVNFLNAEQLSKMSYTSLGRGKGSNPLAPTIFISTKHGRTIENSGHQ